jgi:hypothetical protein
LVLMTEFPPLELAGRLLLALALAVFLSLAFEEVYKREERSVPGGVRTFPMVALAGAMLYLIEAQHALAFVVSVSALCAAILVAASSNNLAKAGYALGFGGVEAARRAASMLLVLALVGFAAAAVYLLAPSP